jgi:hypothetical protein
LRSLVGGRLFPPSRFLFGHFSESGALSKQSWNHAELHFFLAKQLILKRHSDCNSSPASWISTSPSNKPPPPNRPDWKC